MAYSYTPYSGDGSTTTFSFGGIPLINNSLVPVQAQLVVTVDGVVAAYTVSGTDVVLGSAPVLGASVVVTRDTKEDDRYVDWMNTSQIDASVLNLDSDQLFFLAQEAKEIANSAIQTTGGQLDAGNQRVINVATGTQQTDGVNLAQLSAAVVGGVVSEFTAQGYVTYGAVLADETAPVDITLTGLAGRIASDVNVYVQGVKLLASAYSVTDFGQNLNLTIPSGTLSNGDAVQVVWSTGLVTGQVNPNLILWDQILDDVIPYTALDVAPTDDGKFFTVTGGTPVFENIVVSDVTDFDASVRTYSLSDLLAPTGNLSMGGHRVTNVLDALDPTDAPNLAQVQLMIGSSSDGGGTTPGNNGTNGTDGTDGVDGTDGTDGVDGTDGTDGVDGADGDGWTGGSYNSSTGVVTFTSDDGLGFSTGDLRGADGTGGSGAVTSVNGATGVVLVEEVPDYSIASEGQVLSIASAAPSWVTPVTPVRTLDSLSDVLYFDIDTNTIGTPAAGDVLTMTSFGNWGFAAPSTSSGGGASAIDDLSDVDTATAGPAIGDVLEWDGSNWAPATPSGGGSTPVYLQVDATQTAALDSQAGNNTEGFPGAWETPTISSGTWTLTTGGWTIPSTGDYDCFFMAQAQIDTTSTRSSIGGYFTVNGTQAGLGTSDYSRDDQGRMTTSNRRMIALTSGDTVGFVYGKTSNSSVNIQAGTGAAYFSITKLS